MCTCGIAIATQQATPAMQSSVCAAFSDRPNGRVEGTGAPGLATLVATTAAGGRARMREREPGHRHAGEDAEADVSLAPADAGDEMLDDRRPDRAGDIVAAGADRDGDAAPALEPKRGVGDQRRKARRAADQAEQHAVNQGEGPDAARQAGGDEAEAEAGGADQERHGDAAPVGEAPHEDAADAEADHQQRVRQRRVGASDAELGLNARQDHSDDVHRAAANRHQQQCDGEANPGVARVDRVGCHRAIVRTRQ